MALQNSGGIRHPIMEFFDHVVQRHPVCPPPKGHLHTTIFHGATEFSGGGRPGSGSVRNPIAKPFYDVVLRLPSVHHQKGVLIQVLGVLGMLSWSPFPTSFYAIPSVHHPRGVSIRGFSIALLSLLKGGVLMLGSGGVRNMIMKPFYDIVLRHPICPLSKGRLHTTIVYGATEYSGGGVLGALGLLSWGPFPTSFYAIPAVRRQKGVSTQVFFMALLSLLKGKSLCQVFLDVRKALTLKPDSRSIRHAITEPLNDVVLRYPIYAPPKGRPHTSILHGATESPEGGIIMPDSGSVRHAITKPF
ncbi:hypothetical protein B9Z19DRAFT_1134682 [Tuber borchii]|uniref:Uncharacterized protein n=1 Tax=Tuber borchii TaxID=42251 RepID=A0A2T6ZDX5_TUBBO|nr:hypothetical protein B9Z19DRAFT_1134682 [Tuber borchii]